MSAAGARHCMAAYRQPWASDRDEAGQRPRIAYAIRLFGLSPWAHWLSLAVMPLSLAPNRYGPNGVRYKARHIQIRPPARSVYVGPCIHLCGDPCPAIAARRGLLGLGCRRLLPCRWLGHKSHSIIFSYHAVSPCTWGATLPPPSAACCCRKRLAAAAASFAPLLRRSSASRAVLRRYLAFFTFAAFRAFSSLYFFHRTATAALACSSLLAFRVPSALPPLAPITAAATLRGIGLPQCGQFMRCGLF